MLKITNVSPPAKKTKKIFLTIELKITFLNVSNVLRGFLHLELVNDKLNFKSVSLCVRFFN